MLFYEVLFVYLLVFLIAGWTRSFIMLNEWWLAHLLSEAEEKFWREDQWVDMYPEASLMKTWDTSLPRNTTQRDQNCPLLFPGAEIIREIHYTCSQSARVCCWHICATKLWLSATLHTLNFSCYLYSKDKLPVNGKLYPSVHFGSNAW